VLLALADRANDDGECWPGLAYLSAQCSMPRRTLIRALQDLQESGLVSIEHRPGEGGGRSTNIYRLALVNAAKCQPDTRQSAAESLAKCQPDTRQSAKLARGQSAKSAGQSAKNGGAKCQSLAPNPSVDPSEKQPKERECALPRHPHKGRAADPFPDCPAWLNPDDWDAYQQHRREKRTPMGPTTAKHVLAMLEKAKGFGHDPSTLIQEAIAAGWTGCVFADRHFRPKDLPSIAATPAYTARPKHMTLLEWDEYQRRQLHASEETEPDPFASVFQRQPAVPALPALEGSYERTH